MNLRFVVPAVSAALASASLPAVAAIDVTAATDYLGVDVTLALTQVGAAVILLAALAMGFKWIKAMFFG